MILICWMCVGRVLLPRSYGIARLLRLSIGNLRLKIPFEDLPSCRRLVALCQVRPNVAHFLVSNDYPIGASI
jgi:hypothetical protein